MFGFFSHLKQHARFLVLFFYHISRLFHTCFASSDFIVGIHGGKVFWYFFCAFRQKVVAESLDFAQSLVDTRPIVPTGGPFLGASAEAPATTFPSYPIVVTRNTKNQKPPMTNTEGQCQTPPSGFCSDGRLHRALQSSEKGGVAGGTAF